MQVPAVVLGMLGMDRIGRVSLLVICQLIGGAACILAGLLHPPAVLPLALIGKFASSIVFLTVYLYTAEIYPTSVRGMGLALTATMARLYMTMTMTMIQFLFTGLEGSLLPS